MEYTIEIKAWEDPFFEAFTENKIIDVMALQVNPKYFAFDPERVWVLDGGVVFTLENRQQITFGWNKEVELMDMQFCEASVLLKDLDFYEIEEVSEKLQKAIVGKTMSDVEFEWNWYQMLDENLELEEKLNYAPLGIVLKFGNNESLQLASIRFALEGQTLANAKYIPEGDLLISINEIIPITLEEEGEENNMIDY